MVAINNGDTVQGCRIKTDSGERVIRLVAYDTLIQEL